MKICHFVTYYLPITQNWIYNQLIFNKGCNSTVICQRLMNMGQFPFDDVYPICKSSGIKSIPQRLMHKVFGRYPQNPSFSIVERINPDILHGHFLLESWRNYRLVRAMGIPLITTCYGQDVTCLPRKPFWLPRVKKVFDVGAAFIVEGEYMGKTLEALGCSKEKIRVIKLGVDIAKIRSVARYLASDDAASGKETVKFLFIGLNREKKGAVYVAKAFIKALSVVSDMRDNGIDIELHLLGDGIYRRQVEKIFARAGVRQKTVFHGMLPVDKYLELLKNCDVLLAPSVCAANGDSEGGAPVAVIEALCAGIPVVGSNHCDIPSIVAHGKTGLLSNEKDVEALAKDIVTLTANKSLRASMGENGKKYVTDEHDIIKQTDKINDVYREVIALYAKTKGMTYGECG